MHVGRSSPNLDLIAAVSARAYSSATTVGSPNRILEFFGVTVDGELHHRRWDGSWSEWTRMLLPPRERASDVGAAAHGEWVDLFVVTLGGRLLHRWWGPDEGWSDWDDWGNGFSGPVTMASAAVDHTELWVRRGGALVHCWYLDSVWSEWAEFV